MMRYVAAADSGVLRRQRRNVACGRHASGMNTSIVACALVGSRLDYANSVLFGITRRNISKLQKAKNFLARGLCNGPSSSILQFTYSPAAPLASH